MQMATQFQNLKEYNISEIVIFLNCVIFSSFFVTFSVLFSIAKTHQMISEGISKRPYVVHIFFEIYLKFTFSIGGKPFMSELNTPRQLKVVLCFAI